MSRTHDENISGAFTAWRLAIEDAMARQFPSDRSIEDVAKAFGQEITDAESIGLVSEWFEWDAITRHLKR